MKKIFEKYDLLKISGILVLLTVLLTWIIPSGYFRGSEFVAEEITRVGIQDFFNYGVLGLTYFSVLVGLLLVTGGFYQVLSKRAGYQKLVKAISEKLKNAVIPFVLFVSLFFAILGSLVNEYFPLLVLIPFIITILNRMKVDKITSFVATFGGLLVGTLGSTYSTKVAGMITSTLGVEIADVLTTQTIIFVIGFVLLSVFTIWRIVKGKKEKRFEEYDKFNLDEIVTTKDAKNKKVHVWPYALTMILLFVTVALAYLPWESVWEITFFKDITTWVNEFSIAGVPIFSYIFGAFTPFDKWDIYSVQVVMLVVILLINLFGKMPLNEILKSFGEGFAKMGYVIVAMLMAYLVVEFAVMYPVLPTIVNGLTGLAEGFNAFLTSLSAFIASIFSCEMRYPMEMLGSYFAGAYAQFLPEITIIFQTMFGLASFFVPSSIILMIGLAYLNIPYKDWLKFIWKFLLAMLIVVAVIIVIIV